MGVYDALLVSAVALVGGGQACHLWVKGASTMEISDTSGAVAPSTTSEIRKVSSTEQIWGKEVTRHGYTGVPSILIRAQSRLGINSTQMNIILQLLDYWIDPARKPFPSKKDIADRMGLKSGKTIQINVRELEQAGLIRRETRKTAAGDWNSNIYHLDGLIKRVRDLEPDFAEEKRTRAEARKIVETPIGRRGAGP